MATDTFGLPQNLGDDLTLRWATPDDAEALAQFNMAVHSDDPATPDRFLYIWTHDLMNGRHPTTSAGDFTVVTNAAGEIVSSLNLISQTWAYEGIPFPVGRVELVATLPAYRRRGLVRRQMDVIHRLSASRREMVTAITGIPWYYRQFGYDMAIDLAGSRQLFWARPGNNETVAEEVYKARPATAEDIPLLGELYAAHIGQSAIARVRTPVNWQYEMFGTNPESIFRLEAKIITTLDGQPVAYVHAYPRGTGLIVSEVGVRAGHSWRDVGLFLMRYLREEAKVLNGTRPADKQISNISFNLGQAHTIYEALEPELEKQRYPYAWYVRVPDIPAFLRHIAPALEARLAGSVMAGHTGTTRITMFRQRFTLVWDKGRLREVGDDYAYKRLEEADAGFPDLTFLQLLFCYRSIDELVNHYADCYIDNNTTRVLLRVLFPKRPSYVLPME